MTIQDARLGRRLEDLRRGRPALARPGSAAEMDPEIRRAIEAVVAAGVPYGTPQPVWQGTGGLDAASLARRMADGLDADAVETEHGWYVRKELRPVYLPIDRQRLASLPGMPTPGTPLLCLDTETTGLGSAAGTVAFLVGIGWWEGDRMRLLQLLLPDYSEEAALLDALAAEIPAGASLVTYNGRSFDWPLLETRYRMGRRIPPGLDGHLDLLLLVRRLFKHRLPDARLQTVERHLLRRHRAPDIPSWEIPAVYHSFLRGGPAGPVRVVARHNAEDVVTLGRLLAHLERGYGEGEVRRWAPPGDLVRLARLFRHEGRVDEAVACLEMAGEAIDGGDPEVALATVELARLLRRCGRVAEAGVAWSRLVTVPGPLAGLGWIELAKEREHRERDLAGAWAATDQALLALYKSRGQGNAMQRRALEADVAKRRARLARRLERAGFSPGA
ncbi:MAG TPA: ribonuclease H-like domain-containing protein [Candidatus Limnocylindrales bacterium]